MTILHPTFPGNGDVHPDRVSAFKRSELGGRRVQKYKRTQDPRAGLFRNKRVYAWLANGS